jgi:hypothetical protein
VRVCGLCGWRYQITYPAGVAGSTQQGVEGSSGFQIEPEKSRAQDDFGEGQAACIGGPRVLEYVCGSQKPAKRGSRAATCMECLGGGILKWVLTASLAFAYDVSAVRSGVPQHQLRGCVVEVGSTERGRTNRYQGIAGRGEPRRLGMRSFLGARGSRERGSRRECSGWWSR